MERSEHTSQEMLDRLLGEGKISDDEYLRLSKALQPAAAESGEVAQRSVIAQKRKLRKSFEHGEIGGLCAGYAEYSGRDVSAVRIAVIIATVLLGAIGGIGLIVVPLYFALCAMLPWDDEEKGRALAASGRTHLYLAAIALLYFILPTLLSVTVLPAIEAKPHLWDQGIWTREFQSTIAGRAIDCVDTYREFLRFNDGAIVIGLAIAVVVTIFLGTVYANLCKRKLRRQYLVATVGAGVAWALFLFTGTVWAWLTV